MNLQNNKDRDRSGPGFGKPENNLAKGSSETNTRSTSKPKQINKPNIPRITQEQISNFPRVKTISFDDYIDYSESILPGSTKDIDLSFLQWFIGFYEGDGSLITRMNYDKRAIKTTGVTRLSLEIQQKDPKLLKLIQRKLGFGRYNESKGKQGNRNIGKFSIEDQKSVKRLMHLLNGNLTLPKRCAQFDYWVKFGERIQPPNFTLKNQLVEPSLQNGWLSGFIDAEGCFYASYKKTVTKSSKNVDLELGHYTLKQKITITQQDTHGEKQILEGIQLLFNKIGKLAVAKNTTEDITYRTEIHALRSHDVVLKYLLEFPLLSKKRLACFRSYRVYLIRNQVANKTFSLDKSPESIRKLQRLCESINKQAGEIDRVSNQQFQEGDVEEIEISVKQPEE